MLRGNIGKRLINCDPACENPTHSASICFMSQLFLYVGSLPNVIYRLSKKLIHIQPRTCAEAHIWLPDVANLTNIVVFLIITGTSQRNTCSANRRHVQLHEKRYGVVYGICGLICEIQPLLAL